MIEVDNFLRQPRLHPILLLAGDDPFYRREVLDTLRALAREADYERVTLETDRDTDWPALAEQLRAPGLFSQGQLIELTLGKGAPGREGAELIRKLARQPAPDQTVVLIPADSLSNQQLRSAWAQAVQQQGEVIQIRTPPPAQLPRWCQQRAGHYGLTLEFEAAAVLAERSEGNLLAADQALEILQLRYGEGARITPEQVIENVADQAHYELFALSDRLLAGEMLEALHVLDRLLASGTAVQLVVWLLGREVRLGYQLSAFPERAQQWFREHGIWKSRQNAYRRMAERLPPARWARLLARVAEADQIGKGALPGDPARVLADIVAAVCGADQTLEGVMA